MALDLGLNSDQRDIEDLFNGFFEKESPSEVVRKAEPLGFDPALWLKLSEIGAAGMGVPDAEDGSGSFSTLVVACEAFGRRLAPVPLVEHLVASRLVQADDVREGSRIVTLALRPSDQDGCWNLVPSGAIANTVVGMDRDELVAVTSKPPGRAPSNFGSASMADRSARDGEREVIGTRADFERALDHWKLLISAALVGLSATAQDIALQYVMERKAFGRPIGGFQVIQHGLADFPAWIEGARTLVHKAAWATDAMISNGSQADPDGVIDTEDFEIQDPRVLTSMAFSFATESAAKVTDRALHYHGSYGFSLEYDIQLYYRRARGWPLQLGDPAAERRRIADILWPRDSE